MRTKASTGAGGGQSPQGAPGDGRGDEAYLVRSVEKALRILELFDESRPQLTLGQIVELTGMNRVTTYRFCRTLEHLGYLETVGERSYRPGVKVLYLGHAALTSRDLREIAIPALERLREESGETANIAVRDGTEIVYLARVRSNSILSIRLFEGSRLPLYCTSLGKAILAFLPPAELDSLLPALEFRPFTGSTVKSAKALRKVLALVRQAGYAVNDQEYAPGLRGIAAPIFDSDNYPVGAINLATGTPVSIKDFEERHAAKVVEAARSVSEIWATVSSRMDLPLPPSAGVRTRKNR